MNRFIHIVITGMVLGLLASAQAGANGPDWAPFYSRDTDVKGDLRTRMLGPFYEDRQMPDGKSLTAVPPFITTIRDPSDQRKENDVIWPLLINKRQREFRQWRLAGLGLWRDYDVDDPDARYTMWVMPFYFQGRDKAGNPYFAIFPFGGKISDILIWDEVWFALWPIYGHGRLGDIDTYTYLWPFVSSSRGETVQVRRFFVFPFYGYSHRENAFDKHFVLWPFWTDARYYFAKSHGYGWILFPLIGHVGLSDGQESWMFLPPFTRFSRSPKMRQVNCPWPIFQYETGPIEKLYFWPVVGYKVIGDTQTGFLFWPIGITSKRKTVAGINRRYFMVPIIYSETQTRKNPAGAETAETVDARQFKVWPLFSYQRDKDYARFRFPSLCPVKDIPVIDRNYAPLWTLYSHSFKGEVSEDELLWGLAQYRRSSAGLLKTSLFPLFSVEREKSGASVEWSVLKGLVGRERDGDRTRMRLFYFISW